MYLYRLKLLMWTYWARRDLYIYVQNPWRHGGRQGKKKAKLMRTRRPNDRIEYVQLLAAGWRTKTPNGAPWYWWTC